MYTRYMKSSTSRQKSQEWPWNVLLYEFLIRIYTGMCLLVPCRSLVYGLAEGGSKRSVPVGSARRQRSEYEYDKPATILRFKTSGALSTVHRKIHQSASCVANNTCAFKECDGTVPFPTLCVVTEAVVLFMPPICA